MWSREQPEGVDQDQTTPRGPAPKDKPGEETGTRDTPQSPLRLGDDTKSKPAPTPQPQENDVVTESSEESFPASDAPGWGRQSS